MGSGWNEPLPDFEIYNNQLRNKDAFGQEAQYTKPVGADQRVSADCKMTAAGNSCGVIARWSNAGNFYYARIDAGLRNIALFKKVNGTFTRLATASRPLSYNTFYRLQLVAKGTSL